MKGPVIIRNVVTNRLFSGS